MKGLDQINLPNITPSYKTMQAKENTEKVQLGWKKYIGILFAVLSSVLYSLTTLVVKLLHNYHPFSLVIWRHFGNVIPSILIIIYLKCGKKQKILDDVWPMQENSGNIIILLIRGFFGATAGLCRYLSLNYLTISDTTVITNCSPILIIVVAHYWLKEEFGLTPIVIAIWTICGVALISRPPFLTGEEINSSVLIGTGISLGAIICETCVILIVRKIRKMNFAVMMLVFGIVGICEGLITAGAIGELSYPKGAVDICYTIILASSSYLAQLCLIFALKMEEAGPVGLVRCCEVFFAFLWQIVCLNDLPDLYSIFGALIVVSGMLIIGFRKWIEELPENHMTRKIFGFLLY